MEKKNVMSVGSRIFIVAAVFSLPIMVQLYFVARGFLDHTEFAGHELHGDEYQRPLEKQLEGLSKYRWAVKQSKTGHKADVKTAEAMVDEAVKEIMAKDVQLGGELQTSTEKLSERKREHLRPDTFQKEWEDLKTKLPSLSADEADQKIVHLLADSTGLISHIGDTSFLILDPDLDTYYSMDATLLGLPKTQNRIQDLLAHYGGALQSGRLSEADRNQARVDAALLQTDIDEINNDVNTAWNEDKNFFGFSPTLHTKLPAPLKAYNDAAGAVKAMLDKPETLKMDEYIKTAQAALDASFDFSKVYLEEEDVMLQNRWNYFNHGMWMAILMTFAALLISCLLAYYVAKSITIPLTKLSGALSPGANLLHGSVNMIAKAADKGNLTGDQAKTICGELAAHADDMKSTARQLEMLVFGHEVQKQ